MWLELYKIFYLLGCQMPLLYNKQGEEGKGICYRQNNHWPFWPPAVPFQQTPTSRDRFEVKADNLVVFPRGVAWSNYIHESNLVLPL